MINKLRSFYRYTQKTKPLKCLHISDRKIISQQVLQRYHLFVDVKITANMWIKWNVMEIGEGQVVSDNQVKKQNAIIGNR